MIRINDRVFAESVKEAKTYLAEHGKPCFGFALRNRRAIRLLDHRRRVIGAINECGTIGAAEMVDGEEWHSTAEINGIGPISYMTRKALLDSLAVKKEPHGDLMVNYWYK